MRNIRFSCFQCGQHLVAEGEWVGLDIHCPGCGNTLTIPAEGDGHFATPHFAAFNRSEEGELLAVTQQRDALAGERDALAAERDALSAQHKTLAAELEHMRGMLEMAEMAREALQAALRKSKESLSENDEGFLSIQAEHDAAKAELAQTKRLVTEQETALQAAGEEARARAEEARKLAESLSEQTAQLTAAREETEEARRTAAKLAEDFNQSGDALARAFAACAVVEAERDKFKADLAVQFQLEEFLVLKEKNGVSDAKLAEEREAVGRALRELEESRDALRVAGDERVRLALELAASRDALSETKLEQDNAVLRGLVERLNEELKHRPPSRRRRNWLPRREVAMRVFNWPWGRRLAISKPQQTPSL